MLPVMTEKSDTAVPMEIDPIIPTVIKTRSPLVANLKRLKKGTFITCSVFDGGCGGSYSWFRFSMDCLLISG